NHRRSEKRARRNRDARPGGRPGKWGNRRRVRVSTAVEQLAHRKIRKHLRTGKREQLGLGVQTIFKRASWVLAIVELRDIGSAAARRNLTSQQGGGNNPVQESKSATQHHTVLGSYSVSRAKTRVEVFPLRRQGVRRP